MNTQVDDEVGDPPEIPGFSIKEEIGTGSIGTVYRAVQESLDREVALKILSPRWSNYDDYVRRFVREARMLAKLDNPNIVRAYDLGQNDRLFYIVMEFIEGPTLERLIGEKGHPDWLICATAGKDICQALTYADRMGIVHRDIKPANILIPPDMPAKLCDLGHARLRGKKEQDDPFGTPYYTAPEQISGEEGDVDIRSDLYSLGASLFHYLCGEPPFPSEDVNDVLGAHLNDPVPTIRNRNPDVPQKLASLIEKLLRKNPDHRFEYPETCQEEFNDVLAVEKEQRTAEPETEEAEEESSSTREPGVVRKLRKFRRGR